MDKQTLDLRAIREQLMKLRDDLTSIEATGDEAASTVELDQTRVGRLSRMDAMQAQAMSIDAKRRRNEKLADVAQALSRLEADDFGYCDDCGEPIAQGRLNFDPTVTLCVDCAGKREGRP